MFVYSPAPGEKFTGQVLLHYGHVVGTGHAGVGHNGDVKMMVAHVATSSHSDTLSLTVSELRSTGGHISRNMERETNKQLAACDTAAAALLLP